MLNGTGLYRNESGVHPSITTQEPQKYCNSEYDTPSVFEVHPAQIFVLLVSPFLYNVVLFEAKPHQASDKQSYYCSHEKRPKTLAVLIELLKVHSKYGSGKINWYVDKSQYRD